VEENERRTLEERQLSTRHFFDIILAFWHSGILTFWHFDILAFWHSGIQAAFQRYLPDQAAATSEQRSYYFNR
jgi:hypothetical protein